MALKKDEYAVIDIEDIATGGEGIGKVDGYTLFIKDTVPGDKVKVKVIKSKKNYGYAKLLEIIEPSKDRVIPKCPVARQCGGCQIQEMSYEAQLRLKTNIVKNNLKRIGGIEEDKYEMLPIIGMDEPFHYRNKAQFPVGVNSDGKVVIGFYAGRTHYIVNNTDCCIGAEINKDILEIIRDYIENNNIRPYDEKTGKGLIRHILIRTGFHTGEIMVCLILNDKNIKKLKNIECLIENLSQIDGMTSIMANFNTEKTNVILGKESIGIWGKDYIEDYIGDIKFQISPQSFFQVNPVQTEKLYGKALEFAGLTGNETVWDLYCGIGTISLFLAKNAKKVYGVEIVPQAIDDAKNNAQINGIDNAEFFVGKAEEVVPAFYEDALKKVEKSDNKKVLDKDSEAADTYSSIHPEVVVVDPPRKGCDEALLQTIIKMSPDRLVYVSCDSATLARDLKYLTDNGFEIKKVQPVDQFSHSVHVETVVLLSQLKQKPDDYINVTIELDDVDITSVETKATYDEIKKYVAEHNAGMKVSNLYISQVKRKCGIEVGKNYNLPKNEDSRQPQCPEDKESAIVEALKHFKMIQQK